MDTASGQAPESRDELRKQAVTVDKSDGIVSLPCVRLLCAVSETMVSSYPMGFIFGGRLPANKAFFHHPHDFGRILDL